MIELLDTFRSVVASDGFWPLMLCFILLVIIIGLVKVGLWHIDHEGTDRLQ